MCILYIKKKLNKVKINEYFECNVYVYVYIIYI